MLHSTTEQNSKRITKKGRSTLGIIPSLTRGNKRPLGEPSVALSTAEGRRPYPTEWGGSRVGHCQPEHRACPTLALYNSVAHAEPCRRQCLPGLAVC